MTVKQLIVHLLECDLDADVTLEGLAWAADPQGGRTILKGTGTWPVCFVERGTFSDVSGLHERVHNWVKIKGANAWEQNHPIAGKHLVIEEKRY